MPKDIEVTDSTRFKLSIGVVCAIAAGSFSVGMFYFKSEDHEKRITAVEQIVPVVQEIRSDVKVLMEGRRNAVSNGSWDQGSVGSSVSGPQGENPESLQRRLRESRITNENDVGTKVDGRTKEALEDWPG